MKAVIRKVGKKHFVGYEVESLVAAKRLKKSLDSEFALKTKGKVRAPVKKAPLVPIRGKARVLGNESVGYIIAIDVRDGSRILFFSSKTVFHEARNAYIAAKSVTSRGHVRLDGWRIGIPSSFRQAQKQREVTKRKGKKR